MGQKRGPTPSDLPPLNGPPMPNGHYERALLLDFLSERLYAILLQIIETLESKMRYGDLEAFMLNSNSVDAWYDSRYSVYIRRSDLPPALQTLFEGFTLRSGVALFRHLVLNTIVKHREPDNAYCFFMSLDYIFLDHVRHQDGPGGERKILQGGSLMYVVFQAMKLVGARVADRVRHSISDVVGRFEHVVVRVTHPFMESTLGYLVRREQIELGPDRKRFEALVNKGNTGSHEKPLVSFEVLNSDVDRPKVEFRIHPRPDAYKKDPKDPYSREDLVSREYKVHIGLVENVSMVHNIFPERTARHPHVLQYRQNEDSPPGPSRAMGAPEPTETPVWTNMITFQFDPSQVQNRRNPDFQGDNDYTHQSFSQETNHQYEVIHENTHHGLHAITGGSIHQMLRAYIRNITTSLLVETFKALQTRIVGHLQQSNYTSKHHYNKAHLVMDALFFQFSCTLTLKNIKDVPSGGYEYPFQKYSAGWNRVGFSSEDFYPLRIVTKWRIQPRAILSAIQSDLINQMVVSGMVTPNPIPALHYAPPMGLEPIYLISVQVRENTYQWWPDMTGPYGEIRERPGPAMQP